MSLPQQGINTHELNTRRMERSQFHTSVLGDADNRIYSARGAASTAVDLDSCDDLAN